MGTTADKLKKIKETRRGIIDQVYIKGFYNENKMSSFSDYSTIIEGINPYPKIGEWDYPGLSEIGWTEDDFEILRGIEPFFYAGENSVFSVDEETKTVYNHMIELNEEEAINFFLENQHKMTFLPKFSYSARLLDGMDDYNGTMIGVPIIDVSEVNLSSFLPSYTLCSFYLGFINPGQDMEEISYNNQANLLYIPDIDLTNSEASINLTYVFVNTSRGTLRNISKIETIRINDYKEIPSVIKSSNHLLRYSNIKYIKSNLDKLTFSSAIAYDTFSEAYYLEEAPILDVSAVTSGSHSISCGTYSTTYNTYCNLKLHGIATTTYLTNTRMSGEALAYAMENAQEVDGLTFALGSTNSTKVEESLIEEMTSKGWVVTV